HQVQRQGVMDILAAHGKVVGAEAPATAAGAALGAGAEQVLEHIGEIAGLEALAAGIGVVGAAGKVAVILALRALLPGGVDLSGIIAAALFGVGQQVIGGGGGLEPLGRGGVGVQVRVIGLGDAAIGL